MPAQFRATPNKQHWDPPFLVKFKKNKVTPFSRVSSFWNKKELESCHSCLCYKGRNRSLQALMDSAITWWQNPGGALVWWELSWDTARASELVFSPSHLQVPLTAPASKVPWKILSNHTEVHFSDGTEAIPSPQSPKPCHYFPKVQDASDLFSFKLSMAQGLWQKLMLWHEKGCQNVAIFLLPSQASPFFKPLKTERCLLSNTCTSNDFNMP